MGEVCEAIRVGLFGVACPNLLLVVDTNSNNLEPRMQRIDPVTLVATTFASNGPYEELLGLYGLQSEQIAETVTTFLG